MFNPRWFSTIKSCNLPAASMYDVPLNEMSRRFFFGGGGAPTMHWRAIRNAKRVITCMLCYAKIQTPQMLQTVQYYIIDRIIGCQSHYSNISVSQPHKIPFRQNQVMPLPPNIPLCRKPQTPNLNSRKQLLTLPCLKRLKPFTCRLQRIPHRRP